MNIPTQEKKRLIWLHVRYNSGCTQVRPGSYLGPGLYRCSSQVLCHTWVLPRSYSSPTSVEHDEHTFSKKFWFEWENLGFTEGLPGFYLGPTGVPVFYMCLIWVLPKSNLGSTWCNTQVWPGYDPGRTLEGPMSDLWMTFWWANFLINISPYLANTWEFWTHKSSQVLGRYGKYWQ